MEWSVSGSSDITSQVNNSSFLLTDYKWFIFVPAFPQFFIKIEVQSKIEGLFATTLRVTTSPRGRELRGESQERHDQASNPWNTELCYLKGASLLLKGVLNRKSHMFKTSLNMHPPNCHHFGQTKPHQVTSYTDSSMMCKTTSDRHAPFTQETAATAMFAQHAARKSGVAQYKNEPQVLIAQSTYSGYRKFKF